MNVTNRFGKESAPVWDDSSPQPGGPAEQHAYIEKAYAKPKKPIWRKGKYTVLFGGAIAGVWALAAVYALFTPASFTSEMILNMPSAATSSNVSIDAIGQASTSAGNPFASSSMSPKVLYKALAEGAKVRGIAAQILGRENSMIAKPTIKLTDETSIIQITYSAKAAKTAQEENAALLQAIQLYLDVLRKDEVDKRSGAVKDSLKNARFNLDESQKDLLKFRLKHNVQSTEQFRTQVANDEINRQKILDLRAEFQRIEAQKESLSALLGINGNEATYALEIQGDQRFAALSAERATALSEYSLYRGKFGSQHPKVMVAGQRLRAATSAIRFLARDHFGEKGNRLIENLLLSDSKDRAELFRNLVELQTQMIGIKSQIDSLSGDLLTSNTMLSARNEVASQLEDLERDYKIQEAVYSSTVARIDTGAQEIYASYPLLQVISEPSLPSDASSPKPLYALAGAVIGTLLILLAGVLAWMRRPLIQKILKKELYFGP